MFVDDRPGSFPPYDQPELFYVDALSPLEGDPDEDLVAALGWRLAEYDFSFHEAAICSFDSDAAPTHSWVEIAFSRQLASACILWRSGVSPLHAPRSFLYGWLDCWSLDRVDKSLRVKAKRCGFPLAGFYRDYDEYLAAVHGPRGEARHGI